MIEKIKGYFNYFLGGLALILAGLLFRQRLKTSKAESDLVQALTKSKLIENDKDREYAKEDADAANADYDRLKREYDENRTGGGT